MSYYTVTEKEAEATRLIDKGFNAEIDRLAVLGEQNPINDLINLRGANKRVTDILKTVIKYYAPLKANGVIDSQIRSTMLNLMKDKALSALDALMPALKQTVERVEAEIKKEHPDADAIQESIYQAYALRKWPVYKSRFDVENPLLVLQDVKDPKDIRLLREMYRDYYLAKIKAGNKTASNQSVDHDVSQFMIKLDEIETLTGTASTGGVLLKELSFGYSMLNTAEQQVRKAIVELAGTFKTGGQWPIPQWKPDELGNPVVEWVQAPYSKYADPENTWNENYNRYA